MAREGMLRRSHEQCLDFMASHREWCVFVAAADVSATAAVHAPESERLSRMSPKL